MARGHRPHKPWELGPRVWKRGRWYAVDLRFQAMGRPTMRDPSHPAWPKGGRKTESKAEARRWRWAYMDLASPVTKPPRLERAVERYLSERQNIVEPRTLAGDRTVLKHLTDRFPPAQNVADIDLQAWVLDLLRQKYKPSTVRQYLVSLKSFWLWLDIPFPEVVTPKPPKEDVRYWTEEQVAELRKAAPTIDPLLLIALDLTLYMGLRVGEVFALRWSDIDLEHRSVRVSRQIPQGRTTPKPLKGKKARTALILPGWEHAPGEGLIVTRDGSPIGRRVQWRWMVKLLDETGLNAMGVGWHCGRHTYARMCLEAGVSIEQLREFLGHGSVRTTEESYGHLRPTVALQMARRVFYGP